MVTQVLMLLMFTQPCDSGQTAVQVLFLLYHLSCLDFEPESNESEKYSRVHTSSMFDRNWYTGSAVCSLLLLSHVL